MSGDGVEAGCSTEGCAQVPTESLGCQVKEVAAGQGKEPHCLPEQGKGSVNENHGQDTAFSVFNVL